MTATITVLCSTIGRPCLRGLLDSWMEQDRIEGDEFWLYGDGWKGEGWLEEYPIEFIAKPHYGNYGNRWVSEGSRDVKSSHYTFMGDDDRYMPLAFEDMRPNLKDIPLITSIWVHEGLKLKGLNSRTDPDKVIVGMWQWWFPRHIHLPPFGDLHDAEAWRRYVASGGVYEERFDLIPVFYKGYAWDSR